MNPEVSVFRADTIARESAGHPFFIDELARFGGTGDTTTIEEMVRGRVLLLPEGARRFLEVVAVAGQPLDAEVADSAAGLGDETSAVAVLRAGHLVRVRAKGKCQEIETYHDRIREAVVAQIPLETLKESHRRLAVALETSGRGDPEQVALHFQEAGDADRAASYAATAADRAAEALAFNRAARLYRTALELGAQVRQEERRILQVKLGDASANAGRGADAAKAYLAAAEGTARAEALQLERRAAAQLLWSGHVDQAIPLFERITGQIGFTLLQPSWKTRLLFVLHRALIRLRGVNFRERDASQVPAEDLIRLDTFWTLASGIALVNSARGREFQNRHYLLALKSGEPYRVARAIGTEAGYLSGEGWSQRDRIQWLYRFASDLAAKVKEPRALGVAQTWASCASLFIGRWKACWELGQSAEMVIRERCTGMTWELDLAHTVMLRGLYYLGEVKELALRLPDLIREARERDDLLAVGALRLRHAHLTLLGSDEPEKALEELNQIVESLSTKAFTNPHYWALLAGGEIALYTKDTEAVWTLLADRWPAFKRSRLIRFQLYQIESYHLRARAALASEMRPELTSRERRIFLRSAERDARGIERTGAPWALPLAHLIRAGIAAARRDMAGATVLLIKGEEELTRHEMALYAAAARRRRGQLLGGDEGRALVAEADSWMDGQDIKNPARMADMLAPGRWS